MVDDGPSVTGVLRRGLAYEGVAVAAAHLVREGLAAARHRSPDAVLLDVMMPDLDGLEVLRRLRAADEHLPVSMLTAKNAPSDQVRGLEAGADDDGVKPSTPAAGAPAAARG